MRAAAEAAREPEASAGVQERNSVLAEVDGGVRFLHGGLFYAASLATAADALGDVVQTTAELELTAWSS